MGHPELNSDESIILATQNVVVKSVPFEAILTSERLILVNSRDTLMPPQYLPLAAIRSLEAGENAIRDPVITISVSTEGTSTRQMVLTFSRQAGGERKRECDEWVKILNEQIVTFRSKAESTAQGTSEAGIHKEIPTAPPIGSVTKTGKKKIEIARPMKKVIETVPSPKKPIETSSLPQGTFCSRCGSRVPPDSAFCNRCGARVSSTPEKEIEAVPAPEPAVPQVSVPIPPEVLAGTPHKERPIEDVIHSIEPLIEDSKPRTQPAPLVPSRHTSAATPAQQSESTQPLAAPAESNDDAVKKSLEKFSAILVSESSAPSGEPTPAEGTAAPASPALFHAGSTVPPAPPAPTQIPKPRKKGMGFITYAIIVIVVIAIIGGGLLLMKGGNGSVIPVPTTVQTTVATAVPTTTVPTPTPVPTTIVPTATPTPAHPVIPTTGVWVDVIYDGSYTGTYGTPGAQRDVSDTGEHVYQVPAINSVITASFTKNDGTADPLTVKVYYNGAAVQTDTTTTPNGNAQVQVDINAVQPTTAPILIVTPVPATT